MNTIKNSMPVRPLFKGRWSKKINDTILGKIVKVGYSDTTKVDRVIVISTDTGWPPKAFNLDTYELRDIDSPEQIIEYGEILMFDVSTESGL